jgi:UDPglucose 6-dehydrogenase
MPNGVSVIGLGKLGAPMAAAMAARGVRVIGVDADAAKVEAIQHSRPPVFEPALEETLAAAKGRLTATQSVEDAVRDTEITFIVVATPSEPDGGFSLRYVLPVCEAIGRALRSKPEFHLVCLTSTVLPEMTGGPVAESLERASGKQVGRDFGLCYSPEFIALGSVIRDFLNPDFLLIGESDTRSGDLLESLYNVVCKNAPAVARMNFVNAEMAKLAVNTYITTKISFANMLARICEQVPGANVDVVTKAIGLDSRIGGKYLKGSISYGGPCFPRDNLALAHLAHQRGAPGDIAEATHRFNSSQVSWLADMVQRNAAPGETIGILGLTYKPDTDVVEQAAGLLLTQELAARNIPTVVFDPAGPRNVCAPLGDKVRFTATAGECIALAGVVVLATPWPEFISIPSAEWTRDGKSRTVVDCWRAFPHLSGINGVRYVSLGTGFVAETGNASSAARSMGQNK